MHNVSGATVDEVHVNTIADNVRGPCRRLQSVHHHVELDVVVVVLMLHISGHLVVVVDVSIHIEDTDVVQYNVIDEVNVAPEEAEVEDAEVVMVTCELFLERLLDLPRDDALAVEGGLSW